MILSAGLTPAWQHILVFDAFRPGRVNRAVESFWCASGKVFNAAIAVHRLGGESLALAVVGGLPGEQIAEDLDDLGVPHRLIESGAATRVCTTILDRTGRTMTELVANGAPLTAEEHDAMAAAYAEEAARAEMVVLIGSLPGGTPPSYYRRLLGQTPCPVVLDFRGPGLLGVLDLEPLVVKPNREELAQTVGRPLATEGELFEAMRQLNHGGARWVVVTDGDQPVRVTSRREAYRVDPPAVAGDEVVNPIGCGDALAAGMARAIGQGREVVEAVRLGVAAAVDNLGQVLPCRLNPEAIDRLVRQVRVEAVTP